MKEPRIYEIPTIQLVSDRVFEVATVLLVAEEPKPEEQDLARRSLQADRA